MIEYSTVQNLLEGTGGKSLPALNVVICLETNAATSGQDG